MTEEEIKARREIIYNLISKYEAEEAIEFYGKLVRILNIYHVMSMEFMTYTFTFSDYSELKLILPYRQ